jgi:hypothetical protein
MKDSRVEVLDEIASCICNYCTGYCCIKIFFFNIYAIILKNLLSRDRKLLASKC